MTAQETGVYYAILHPATVDLLRHMAAREQWYSAYHAYRLHWRDEPLSPREILEKYSSSPFALGELSHFLGVRIVDTIA